MQEKGSIITSNSFGGNFLQLDEEKKNVQKVQIIFSGKNGLKLPHYEEKNKSKVTIFREQVQTSHQPPTSQTWNAKTLLTSIEHEFIS